MLELAVEAARGKGRVLEVAAGTGLVTTAIAPVVGEMVATDYSREMVAQLERRVAEAELANVRCQQADLYDLRAGGEDGEGGGAFDAVVAANVLHLVPDLPGALASVRRVLKPGGVLVAPTYLHRETIGAAVLSRVFALTGFPGRRRFTAQALRDEISGAGFVIGRTETIAGPFPIGFVEAMRRD